MYGVDFSVTKPFLSALSVMDFSIESLKLKNKNKDEDEGGKHKRTRTS